MRGLSVLLVKSGVDNRYSATEVVSHTGERRSCLAVPRLADLYGSPHLENARVIAVDEGQFFDDLTDFAVQCADVLGKQIIVAGLSGDYR